MFLNWIEIDRPGETTSKKSTITLAVAPTIQIVLATCLLSAGKADIISGLRQSRRVVH
jgi:hypothetical protein